MLRQRNVVENGAVWSAAGYTGYSGTRACLKKLYSELSAGHPVIVHLKTTVSGVKRHTNRTSTYEYHLTSSGWNEGELPPHCHQRCVWPLGLRGGHPCGCRPAKT